jgi:hypothetical protein
LTQPISAEPSFVAAHDDWQTYVRVGQNKNRFTGRHTASPARRTLSAG